MKNTVEVKDYTLKDFLEMALALDDTTKEKLYYMMQGVKLLTGTEKQKTGS